MTITVSATRVPMTIAEGTALVARWQASGQRQCDFCTAEGIPAHRLSRWVRRLAVAGGEVPPVQSGGFSLGVVGSGVRVRLINGSAVEVDPGFDAGLLRRVVEALC